MSILHQLIHLLLIPILAAIYIFMVLRFFRTLKLHQKRVEHTELLMSILSAGLCSPIHKAIYRRLSEMPVDKAVEATKNKGELFRLMASESFIDARKVLEKIKVEAPLDKKEEFQLAIDELDGMFNLLSTVDENTSIEHINKIMYDVGVSLNKLNEKGIHIGLQGFGPFEQI